MDVTAFSRTSFLYHEMSPTPHARARYSKVYSARNVVPSFIPTRSPLAGLLKITNITSPHNNRTLKQVDMFRKTPEITFRNNIRKPITPHHILKFRPHAKSISSTVI